MYDALVLVRAFRTSRNTFIGVAPLNPFARGFSPVHGYMGADTSLDLVFSYSQVLVTPANEPDSRQRPISRLWGAAPMEYMMLKG